MSGKNDTTESDKPARRPASASEASNEQGQPQPGTQGPAGHLDDQPQREDEYLSKVLKEFNPQRKDRHKPVPGAGQGREVKGSDTREKDDTPDDDPGSDGGQHA